MQSSKDAAFINHNLYWVMVMELPLSIPASVSNSKNSLSNSLVGPHIRFVTGALSRVKRCLLMVLQEKAHNTRL